MPPFDMGRPRDKGTLADVIPCGACAVRCLTVCAAMEAEELRRLADISVSHRLEAGQIIFAEGDLADAMFNVTVGTVKLYKLLPDGRRQIIGFALPGEAEHWIPTPQKLAAAGVDGGQRASLRERRFDRAPRDVPALAADQQRVHAEGAHPLTADAA